MPERLRFGIFDFEPVTGELRREGVTVRLQAQPAQVLGVLLAHAGEVVARESLRQAVWGADTFVDFDRGLNFCVAQIRSALGDSAESPRFVRTIPKKGYQFVAPVSGREEPEPARQANRGWRAMVAVAFVLAAAGAMVEWKPWAAKPVRVAVARFDNETGNGDYDRFTDGLTDSLVAELAASGPGRFEVIGNAAILRGPRAKRNLLEIGSSLNAGYVILGQMQRDASGMRVIASLITLPEQTHVRVSRMEIAAEGPLPSERDAARRISDAFSAPLAEGRRRRIASPVPATH